MSATFVEVKDDVCTLFNTAWQTITPTVPPVKWPGKPNYNAPGPGDSSWARVAMPGDSGSQSSLANAVGQIRYERNGPIIVQIFTPIAEDLDADELGRTYAQVVVDAFQGSSTSKQIWFRSIDLNIIGENGTFWQVNVVINFNYDQIK